MTIRAIVAVILMIMSNLNYYVIIFIVLEMIENYMHATASAYPLVL